jgi:FkbM family methyltransferase
MNYFIDCGTHFGQGLKQISSLFGMDSKWKIFTFEANPVTHKIFIDQHYSSIKAKFPLLESINAAVSHHDGEIDLNIEIPPGEGETGQGTSIISLDEWKPQGGKLVFREQPVRIRCVDFKKFIHDLNLSENDKLIVKLDVEGAEYDILESLISDETIQKVSEILIEFHHHYFTNHEEILRRENLIKQSLISRGVTFRVWH